MFEESVAGEFRLVEELNDVIPMVLELTETKEQDIMQEELVNIPIVMAARQDILKERVSNIQRQQGEESQLGDMGSSKKWKD